MLARAALKASGTAASSRARRTSVVASSSSQRTTSAIEAPVVAAANSRGARSFSAFAYQKPASSIPPFPALATEHNEEAIRLAPGQVVALANGDHPDARVPISIRLTAPVGS